MAGDWSAVLPERQRRELKELLVPRSQPAMSGGGVGWVGRVGWKPGGWEEEEGLGVHALSSLSPLFTKPFRPLLSLRSEVNIELNFPPQTSRGSFSAVSTPIFASKYALESSRRDLHNALLCTVL